MLDYNNFFNINKFIKKNIITIMFSKPIEEEEILNFNHPNKNLDDTLLGEVPDTPNNGNEEPNLIDQYFEGINFDKDFIDKKKWEESFNNIFSTDQTNIIINDLDYDDEFLYIKDSKDLESRIPNNNNITNINSEEIINLNKSGCFAESSNFFKPSNVNKANLDNKNDKINNSLQIKNGISTINFHEKNDNKNNLFDAFTENQNLISKELNVCNIKEKIFQIEKIPKKIDNNLGNNDLLPSNYLESKYNNNYEIKKKPEYFCLSDIKKIDQFNILFNGENPIFENESILNDTEKNGKFYNYLLNYLQPPKKEKKEEKEENRIDGMIKKFITFIKKQIRDSINDFGVMNNNKIESIKKEEKSLNSKELLILLDTEIKYIVSSEVSGSNPKANYQRICNILKEYNKGNEKYIQLYKFICFTFRNCLNNLTFKEDYYNYSFKKDAFYFIIAQYKKEVEKQEKSKSDINDYILALILFCWNFERVLCIRYENWEKKKSNT